VDTRAIPVEMSSQDPGGGASPQAPLPPAVPPPPSRFPTAVPYPPPPGPPARRRGGRWAIGVGAVALLLAGVLIGYVAFQPHGLRLPAAIDGVSRLSGTRWDNVAGGMIGAAGTRRQTNVAGVYGTAGRPLFVFLATDGASPTESNVPTIGLLAQYLEYRLNLSLNVDLTQTTMTRRGGVTYECAPMGVSSVSGFACAWNDAGTTGYVLSFSPKGDPVDLTAAVRSTALR